ncbi:MAG: L-threonine 3-dehydrogenase [Bacteroidetes bacterium]|nr:L-threonine 3-dehydrogenase [Bacteroidota bacterium]MCL5025716.1 L-threonine 3-dehydrogenase [Chloroflexota bacterium]
MKAVVKHEAGPGAKLMDMPMPKAGPRDLLVRVKAAAICGTDNHIMEWNGYAQARVKPPMIFGHEFAGDVIEVGNQVTKFKVGDRVAADTHIPDGTCYQCNTGNQHICENMAILGVHCDGAFAEYLALPESCAWKIPSTRSYDEGAVMEPMGVAVHSVLMERIDGKSVAIFGCGPIGMFAVASAAACGASKIFAVEVSPDRLAMTAKYVPSAIMLNGREVNPVEEIRKQTNGLGADVCIEIAGVPITANQALQACRKNGRVSLTGLTGTTVTIDTVTDIIYKELRVYGTTGRHMWETWYTMESLLETGKVDPKPVITHRFPLADFEEALALAKGGKAGKVLLYP